MPKCRRMAGRSCFSKEPRAARPGVDRSGAARAARCLPDVKGLQSMTTIMITMLLGWFLGSFGWMAIAAIAATVLVYAFKGRKAAAVTAVLAVAALIGWRSFARNGWAAAGGPGRQLTAKQQLGAKQARERKQWKNWNKGAEEQLNKASAQLAMQTNPMGGGMSMPYVQVPKIGPPTGAPAHSGPLFGGTPGRVTVAASQTAPVAAAVPAAAPPA